MYYKLWKSGMMKQVDLNDTQAGAMFLVCPGPSLEKEDLTLLDKPGIVTMGVNSSILMYRPNYWITLDQPSSFPAAAMQDGSIMKLLKINTYRTPVADRPACTYPNTIFFGMSEGFTTSTLLEQTRDVVWWRNTFFAAIQVGYRLGFRRMYLLGVDFKITQEKPYCHSQVLAPQYVRGNRALYNDSVVKMGELKAHFEKKGLEIKRINPHSALTMYPYISLKDAVERERCG